MNRILKSASLLLALLWAGGASAADVGVSIHIGDPGYYGRIDLGYAPRPQLVYAQPVLIGRPVGYGSPVYLRVPPRHRDRWARHCDAYQACGVPVYFVQDQWYNSVYIPAYRERHDHRHHDRGHGHHKHHDRGNGRGHGHGRGHGRHDGHDGHRERHGRH